MHHDILKNSIAYNLIIDDEIIEGFLSTHISAAAAAGAKKREKKKREREKIKI